jgi:hypothetical protein
MNKTKEKKMEYEIERNLVVSTGHISQEDDVLLTDEAETNLTPDLVVYKYEYGYLIYISDPLDELIEGRIKKNYTEAFVNLLKLAKEQKCSYLKLDCDGQIYDNLPTFDW